MRPEYLPDQSSPQESRYVFAYHIRITNLGDEAAQLINRHWIITDANSQIREVKGEGVIGEQPRLEPGYGFEYTSGVMLDTPVGTMEGSYEMVADDGESFTAAIPVFLLSVPGAVN